MTPEQHKAIAEATVDHTVRTLRQCIDELNKQYGELHGHAFVVAARLPLMDATAELRDLVIAINQTLTAQPIAAE